MKYYLTLFLALVGRSACESNSVIDLSVWDSSTNMAQIKASGISAVIHKATQGSTYVDPMYATRRAYAEAAGLLWGAYHFGVDGLGKEQASHFLKTVGSENTSKVLLAIELEENKTGKSMSKPDADEFVKVIREETGRYPVIYGSPYYLEHFNTSALRSCPLWVIHHTTKSNLQIPRGWDYWVLWQYTDGTLGGSPHTVKGIGACHRDKYNGSREQLKKKWPDV